MLAACAGSLTWIFPKPAQLVRSPRPRSVLAVPGAGCWLAFTEVAVPLVTGFFVAVASQEVSWKIFALFGSAGTRFISQPALRPAP